MKITIDNEEVLCDKNFTIEEEMLNTSSVILNNVYPATWEQDKDYTSRFYYPKDYSKCKIFNEIVHPTTREDAEGTSFSIEVDTTKQYQVQTLKGQTTQTGTPTPSSPIPINITTGRQVVSVCGKNLFDGVFRQGNRYTNGLNDTTRLFTTQNYFVKSGQAYTISTTLNTSTYKYAINLSTIPFPIVSGTSYYYDSGWKYTSSFTFTPSQDGYLGIVVSKSNGTDSLTPNDISDINWQLEKGNTPSTYEEYKGNDYEINLGKNLFNTHSGTTITSVNVQFTRNDDGTITLNGTSNNYGYVEILYAFQNGTYQQSNINIPLNSSYTYSISLTKLSGTTSNNDIRFVCQYDSSGNQKTTYMGTPETISNCEGLYRAYIRIPPSVVFTNLKLGIQLEKGSVATSYTPYKTPIYLGKIGTYQDYIFRNTTENPLYDSNLEEGQWYIHKEIGRVV